MLTLCIVILTERGDDSIAANSFPVIASATGLLIMVVRAPYIYLALRRGAFSAALRRVPIFMAGLSLSLLYFVGTGWPGDTLVAIVVVGGIGETMALRWRRRVDAGRTKREEAGREAERP